MSATTTPTLHRAAPTSATKPHSPPVAQTADGRVLDHALLLVWLLRVACVLEFVGHGAFGIITKAAWVPYFDLVGIPERWAYRLMPLVGSVDIFMGFLVLLKPVRAALWRVGVVVALIETALRWQCVERVRRS